METIDTTVGAEPEIQQLPAQIRAFSFDGKTGVYVGETVAELSPLETGVYLVPRHATTEEPPVEVEAGFAPFWRGDRWEVEAVPEQDENLDGIQDAPQGFEQSAERPGYFVRLVRALVGR